jgi:SAM-dependent methyltransferase
LTADAPLPDHALRCLDCGGPLAIRESGLFDTRFGIPGTWSAAACGACGLEQLTPPPSREELERLYESHYNFGGERDTAYTRLRDRFHSSTFYRMWTMIDGDIFFHGVKGRGRLLDVGCNEGRGLLLYRRNGWQAEGLEPNGKAAEEARRKGFTVHSMPVEDFVPERPYDVVVLSNVLEHSLDPRGMLRRVRNLLDPGGQLWISAPNGASALRGLFGRSWINWHVPFHTFQFTPGTLGRLLAETGFGAPAVRQETPALWAAQSLIAAACARPGSPTRALRNPAPVAVLLLGIRAFLFPLLWLANRSGRGDCLVVRAART